MNYFELCELLNSLKKDPKGNKDLIEFYTKMKKDLWKRITKEVSLQLANI